MDPCYLSDRQKQLLIAIKDGLKDGSVQTVLTLNYAGNNIRSIVGIPDIIWNTVWIGITLQDFRDFMDCGIVNGGTGMATSNSGSASLAYSLNKHKIIALVERNFEEPVSKTIILNQGQPSMDDCYTNPRQKDMLTVLAAGLEAGSIKTQWRVVYGDDTIQHIWGLNDDDKMTDEAVALWETITDDDINTFIDCNLMEEPFKTLGADRTIRLNKGRIINFVKNGFKASSQQSQQPSQTFNIHGDISGHGINIGTVLNNSSQSIQVIAKLNDEQREKLELLIQELRKELETAPAENKEQAEAVAMQASRLVEDVKSGNKPMIKISSDGLIVAATALVTVMPAVLDIATQIITYIGQWMR